MLSTPSRSPGRAVLRAPPTPTPSTSSSRMYSHSHSHGQTAQLPTRVFASDAELSALLRTDMQSSDFALRQLISAQQDRRRAHEASLHDLRQQESKVERLQQQLELAHKEVQAALEREKEERHVGQGKVEELKRQRKVLEESVESTRADVEEWTAKLHRARAAHQQLEEQLSRQAARNAPELAFIEARLGIKVRGKGRDVLSFTFVNIDASSFGRAYTFDLDMSSTYSIIGCNPSIPSSTLHSTVQAVNSGQRDLIWLIKAMRKAWIEGMGKAAAEARRQALALVQV